MKFNYKKMTLIIRTSLILLFLSSTTLYGQTREEQLERVKGGGTLNTITTAVPFLLISPDSRAGGMGDVGVATSPDVNSTHWNVSKLAFSEQEMGVSFSYIPWLRNLVPDINMVYLSGFKKINEQTVVSSSIRYFSLGEINLTDDIGNTFQTINPNEVAVDGAVSYKLSEKFSGGFALRYIFSNLTAGVSVGGNESKPARGLAADLNGFYTTDLELGEYDSKFNFGFNISNIGTKVSYSETAERDFIPINLRLGAGLEMEIDDYNTFGVYLDINKLLVPTPPVYLLDDNSQIDIDEDTGEPIILAGQNPNVSVPVGIFQSFYDAPAGFKEEMSEIVYSLGMEYWYDKQFAVRGGFLYEDPNKGNRQYFTLGAGIKYEMLTMDFSYLISINQRNPLENTIRFTLGIDFAELNKKTEN